MKFLKKAVVAAAAVSMLTAPVVASAAPAQFDGIRADSSVSGMAFGSNDDDAGGAWLVWLLGGAAIIGGLILLIDGGDDNPTSP